jgi:hypothetical protein
MRPSWWLARKELITQSAYSARHGRPFPGSISGVTGSTRQDTRRSQERSLSTLATGNAVTIFVRGRANNIGFKGPAGLYGGLCSGNSVSYLPYDRSAKKYASAAARQVLARTYTNQELPNLRAAFIACIAQANAQPAELAILQGEIAETTDRRVLTAEMFLFAGTLR